MSIELNYYELYIYWNSSHFLWDGDQDEFDLNIASYKQIIDIKDWNKQLFCLSDNKLFKTPWLSTEHVEAILNLRYFI